MGTLLVKVGNADVEIIDDDRVAAAVRRNGQFEPESLLAWGKICEKGSAKFVLDVGSYGGLFGIAAAHMKNKVVGIEPMPIMVRRTKANQALNGVQYTVVEAGASDKEGKAIIGFNPSVLLTSGASLALKGKAQMEVKTIVLDDYIDEPVGAIKIDVEGHEAAAIRGGLKMIKRRRPWMLVETLQNDERKKEVTALLAETHVLVKFMDGRNLLFKARY